MASTDTVTLISSVFSADVRHVNVKSAINTLPYATVTVNTSSSFHEEDVAGTNLTLSCNQISYGGLVTELQQTAFNQYHLVVRPWLWMLTHQSHNRVFQNLTYQEIIYKIFAENGISDYTFLFCCKAKKRPFCLQYQESDYQFICRLMAEEKVCWFFRYQPGRHILLLVQDYNALTSVVGSFKLSYSTSSQHELNIIYSVKKSFSVISNPIKKISGKSRCALFRSGSRFTLTHHDNGSLNREWLLTRVTHIFDGQHYYNHFTAVTSATSHESTDLPFQPAIPPQIATVMAVSGEGVTLAFIWDGCPAENTMATLANNCNLPLTAGQKVIVCFIAGDPDKPLILAKIQ